MPVVPVHGLTATEAEHRLTTSGPNEVPEARSHPLIELARRFWGPVAWMLEAALVLELVLAKWPEATILVALLGFNAVLAQLQERRANAALALLRHRLRVNARVLRDGAWSTVPARELVLGDYIHLRMGDVVPADCRVVEGDVEVDQATLTGESAPVARAAGGTLYSSSIVRRGDASVEVTATGPRSYFGKTADLVRTARTVSHLENLLFSIVRQLVTLDAGLAVLVLGVAAVRGVGLSEVIPFVLILLIASVPAAMPAAFTIANALESRRLVEDGVLVTGLTAIQEAASMDVLCVDKTGTLTEGKEGLSIVAPIGAGSEAELLALACAACDRSTGDAIDLAVLGEGQRRGIPPLPRTKFLAFDPTTKRSEAIVARSGGTERVVLGSPAVVARLCTNAPSTFPADVDRLSAGGGRVLAVASGPSSGLELRGLLALSDRLRPDAAAMVRSLHAMGVRVILITGDTVATARAVAREVGIGDRVGERADLTRYPAAVDALAGVYPEDKYRVVAALQSAHHVVGMTGDGVNDAPALKQAEVGIAVANATDVARASAKLVLTRPGLSDVVTATESGRRVYRRMLSWTLNKVSKNFEQVFLLSVGFIVAGIFVTSPFLILLLVFANDFVSMAVGSDNARVSLAPDRWEVREIFATAGVVGGSWLALSFTLLWWALAVAHLSLAATQTFFFAYLVFGSQGTILLVRERRHAWSSRPSSFLLAVVAADVLVVSALAITGTLMPAAIAPTLFLGLLGTVVVFALLVDFVKVAFLRWSRAFEPGSRLLRGRTASGRSTPDAVQ